MKRFFLQIKSLNNEKGVALIVVLLVLVVISILGISLIGLASTNLKMSSGDRDTQSAYYIAESGVTYRMNMIEPKLKEAYGQAVTGSDFFTRVNNTMEVGAVKEYKDFEQTSGGQPVATTTIEQVPSSTPISYSYDYKVTSIGKINNRTRKVVKVFHLSWKPRTSVTIPADTVLFVKDSLVLKNVPVDGSIGTSGTMSEVTLNGSKAIVSGNIYTNVSTPLNIPDFPVFMIINTNNYSMTATEQTLTLSSDMAFNTLTVNNGQTLTIDVGNYNKDLVLNNLNVYGKIKVVGTGKLSFYVKNITMGPGSIIGTEGNILGTDTNIEKIYVFLEGTAANIGGKISGSMYAKNSDIVIDQAKGKGVLGHIITGGFNISYLSNDNTVPKMIFAPNASVSINTSFSGSIIARTLTSSGNDDNFIFKFVQINYDSSPLFVDNGTGLSPVKEMITTEPTRESN
ncbi:PilX-like prepilin protein [Neobacillus bataviensis]|uniref:PilX-like prepilin protein n=1 Tax=Neobacillus bataviensis TaxID=220685 RepID=A0A561DGR7_9BACI|nr:PilX N-terminal domain-containing pilus assembly protein [Neobacillus bataviensis]TWE02563.1 PilX-like prepilin protein [Neobacillus bataviensis]